MVDKSKYMKSASIKTYLILPYSLYFIACFILSGCDDINNPEYWKKIGELDLKGKKLIITISKQDKFKEKLIRFYFASQERTLFKNPESYQIAFYNGSLLTLNKDDSHGNYQEEAYVNMDIKQDPFNYYLEIPNRFFPTEGMKLWSAYEKEVFVSRIKLYRKKTGKIDRRDPYPYISIFNTLRRENIK